MKVAFLGSAEFSKIVLERLFCSKHQVVCAITNLDKQVGRGKKFAYNEVKTFSIENNIPLLQYEKVSTETAVCEIKKYSPDILVTASFGQLLKKNILELAKFGVINVHASLLPKYRGSCPINWCLINGEKQTGITIMQTVLGLDKGDMILSKSIDILPQETAGELTLRLAKLGGDLLVEALDEIENFKAIYTPQDESLATYFPKLDKENSYIDFDKTPIQISNFCAGLNPWPVARVYFEDSFLKVFSAKPYDKVITENNFKNGQVVIASSKEGLVVKCKDGYVLLDTIQAPNKQVMSSKSYLNGKKIAPSTYLVRG